MCKTKMGPLQRVAERERNTCKENKKKKRKKKGEQGRREMALLVVEGVCMSFFGYVIVALPALWLCVPGG